MTRLNPFRLMWIAEERSDTEKILCERSNSISPPNIFNYPSDAVFHSFLQTPIVEKYHAEN